MSKCRRARRSCRPSLFPSPSPPPFFVCVCQLYGACGQWSRRPSCARHVAAPSRRIRHPLRLPARKGIRSTPLRPASLASDQGYPGILPASKGPRRGREAKGRTQSQLPAAAAAASGRLASRHLASASSPIHASRVRQESVVKAKTSVENLGTDLEDQIHPQKWIRTSSAHPGAGAAPAARRSWGAPVSAVPSVLSGRVVI